MTTPLSPLDLRGHNPAVQLYSDSNNPGPMTPACTPTWNADPFNYQIQMTEFGPVGTPAHAHQGTQFYAQQGQTGLLDSAEAQNLDSSGLSDYLEYYAHSNQYPVLGDYLPDKWSEGHDGSRN